MQHRGTGGIVTFHVSFKDAAMAEKVEEKEVRGRRGGGRRGGGRSEAMSEASCQQD